jgi:BMFP domain-containing protein YqiC
MLILTMFKQLLYDLPKHLKNELEHQLQDKTKLALQKMNLISRDEFDIQTEVLKKTRLKLEALEKKLAHLELLIPKELP